MEGVKVEEVEAEAEGAEVDGVEVEGAEVEAEVEVREWRRRSEWGWGLKVASVGGLKAKGVDWRWMEWVWRESRDWRC